MTCTRIAGLIGLLGAMLTFGQAPKDGPALDVGRAKTRTAPDLRVDVDLVMVHATVTDASNGYVSGLKQGDFEVWEDRIEQQIDYFFAENVPVSVGIVFDVSGSMRVGDKLEAARTAANTFLRMGDRDDEYFLIHFSDSPQLAQDFTTDITKLQSRLLFTRANGNTSLYDALYLALTKVNRGRNPRKALLLITDGEDNHSRYSLPDVKAFAREHDVMIYSVGIVDEGVSELSELSGRATLQTLSHLTGGVAFFPNFLGSLSGICAQIARELKNQYVIGYRPLNLSNDGKWRKIRVKMKTPKGKPQLNVRAKSGYYASAVAKTMN
jgi:Ca-activated chloride channel family protein